MKKDITILNYPGSKKRLLDFIDKTIAANVKNVVSIFDIFAGTHSVGYYLSEKYKILANDSEFYSYLIGKSLLKKVDLTNLDSIVKKLIEISDTHIELIDKHYPEVKIEQLYINKQDTNLMIDLYDEFPTISKSNFKTNAPRDSYHLFLDYYSTTYFGIKQSIEIDSLRYAIDRLENKEYFAIFMASLFYAMKETVFSKDGHMAQPLDKSKNLSRLIRQRKKSVIFYFLNKIDDFKNNDFFNNENEVYNYNLDYLLESNEILKKADLVYADPPYTDMQYSRYFHLLDTVAKYDYPKLTIKNNFYTSGLYRENRFQSPLSQHGKAKEKIESLIETCAKNNQYLVFSYAYPVDTINQATNRYTISIQELIDLFIKHYSLENTVIEKIEFNHSNNRNKNQKAVFEYLIIGKRNE